MFAPRKTLLPFLSSILAISVDVVVFPFEPVIAMIGVVINIDSPATDSLGRAGIGGFIDNHYFERFPLS